MLEEIKFIVQKNRLKQFIFKTIDYYLVNPNKMSAN